MRCDKIYAMNSPSGQKRGKAIWVIWKNLISGWKMIISTGIQRTNCLQFVMTKVKLKSVSIRSWNLVPAVCAA